MPEYFKDYCKMPCCNSVMKELTQATMTQRLVGVYFLRADAKLSIYNSTY